MNTKKLLGKNLILDFQMLRSEFYGHYSFKMLLRDPARLWWYRSLQY